ncbi:MAG: hypothetical protein HYU64_03540 [Armatimonadetes bacterium]|nr:hypothetical protein [Armatimonadota bacterium]
MHTQAVLRNPAIYSTIGNAVCVGRALQPDAPAGTSDNFVRTSQETCKEKEWTLLFYNAGEGCESKMSTASLLDLEKAGSDENTHVVVMNYRSPWLFEKVTGTDREFLGTRTYYVTKSQSAVRHRSPFSDILTEEAKSLQDFLTTSPKSIRSSVIEQHPQGTNMGDGKTLREFLLKNMEKYPAKHYAVILSGHGAAFGGSMIVHHPEGRISNEVLGEVLQDVTRKIGRRIDLVDMNTCFSANVESVYPLRNSIETLVASEGTVFAATQPFGKVLSDLQQGLREGRRVSGADLARLIVKESRLQPLGSLYTGSLSALSMTKLPEVVSGIKDLQDTLMVEKIPPEEIRQALKDSVKVDYSSIPRQIDLTDIGSFADRIIRNTDSGKVRESAGRLKLALDDCITGEQHRDPSSMSVTGKVVGLAMGTKEDLHGLSGLTIYYDEDAEHPDSRLDQLRKTEYAKDVKAEAFLSYLNQAARKEREEAPFLKKCLLQGREKHKKWLEKLSKKTGVHSYFLTLAERIATGVGLAVAFRVLGAAGVPAYPLVVGSFLTARGLSNVFSGIKSAMAPGQEEVRRKEAMVDAVGKGALGLAAGCFGLHLLGFLPSSVAWPAALAAVAIRGGKEIAKIALHRKDRAVLIEERREFAAASFEGKLALIQVRENEAVAPLSRGYKNEEGFTCKSVPVSMQQQTQAGMIRNG